MSTTEPPRQPVQTEPQCLAQRGLVALKWSYLGVAGRVLSQLIIGIVLARQLGPEPFGLIAVAWLMLGLGNLIADSGLGVALIHMETLFPRDIRFVFSLQMVAGLSLSLLGSLAAPSIAAFFGRPDATPVLAWMSLLFILQAFGQTASALMRRSLEHKRVQLLQLASYLVAYLLIGLPLAFAGFGVWSLVAAQLIQSASYSLSAYLSIRHSLLPALRAEQPGLFRFGAKVLGSNLTSWGISYFDAAIVGRMLGMIDLGFYNRSMNLLAAPMNAAVSTLQGVLLPLYARLQGRIDDARDTYLATLSLICLALAPAFAAIAAMPETTMLAIYGHGWQAASVLVTPLALAMPVNALLALAGPMMQGLGRPGIEAVSQGFGLIVLIIALIAAARISLAAVGWAVLGAYLLRAWLVTRLALKLVLASFRMLPRVLSGPVFLAIMAALLAMAADQGLAPLITHFMARFVATLAIVASVILLAIGAGGRWLFCAEAKQLLSRSRPHLPQRAHALLRHWGVA